MEDQSLRAAMLAADRDGRAAAADQAGALTGEAYSRNRWTRMSAIVVNVNRLVEIAARLDAFSQQPPGMSFLRRFDEQMDKLEARVDHEISRLTVERMDADLARKRAKVAELAACARSGELTARAEEAIDASRD